MYTAMACYKLKSSFSYNNENNFELKRPVKHYLILMDDTSLQYFYTFSIAIVTCCIFYLSFLKRKNMTDCF